MFEHIKEQIAEAIRDALLSMAQEAAQAGWNCIMGLTGGPVGLIAILAGIIVLFCFGRWLLKKLFRPALLLTTVVVAGLMVFASGMLDAEESVAAAELIEADAFAEKVSDEAIEEFRSEPPPQTAMVPGGAGVMPAVTGGMPPAFATPVPHLPASAGLPIIFARSAPSGGGVQPSHTAVTHTSASFQPGPGGASRPPGQTANNTTHKPAATSQTAAAPPKKAHPPPTPPGPLMAGKHATAAPHRTGSDKPPATHHVSAPTKPSGEGASLWSWLAGRGETKPKTQSKTPSAANSVSPAAVQPRHTSTGQITHAASGGNTIRSHITTKPPGGSYATNSPYHAATQATRSSIPSLPTGVSRSYSSSHAGGFSSGGALGYGNDSLARARIMEAQQAARARAAQPYGLGGIGRYQTNSLGGHGGLGVAPQAFSGTGGYQTQHNSRYDHQAAIRMQNAIAEHQMNMMINGYMNSVGSYGGHMMGGHPGGFGGGHLGGHPLGGHAMGGHHVGHH